jgi:hypothetical protein
MKMSIRKFEIERFSVTSLKPFEAVMAALKAGVGATGFGGVRESVQVGR